MEFTNEIPDEISPRALRWNFAVKFYRWNFKISKILSTKLRFAVKF
ncbi:hypothetical protein CAMGR0001_0857 [Campylobacter gracilis RM3268]|uniref:Uncharacterized protein n=1 Tax=Campylobacter gracilis RM3268 TaxID=553220 RepID=C8PG64_9BACT|nr:hypothetical protein CAMGR0001_0857 [Campylobacter gracilis RM3268]